MEQIFESECDAERTISVVRVVDGSGDLWLEVRSIGSSYNVRMVREDGEAMARAILGIPDPPLLDWEQCVADMRATAALAALDEARAHAAVA